MTAKNSEKKNPISLTIDSSTSSKSTHSNTTRSKKRILFITILSFFIAICISFIGKLLIEFIFLITNIFFYGDFSFVPRGPAGNELGLLVILIPVIGGLVVGFMVLYGSKDIRGHGIPEAMENILTKKSRVHPAITYLKPIASAIAIGTGGPFGAEGPIIATGGALGSTLGQITKITPNERKILLAAGAAAGMAAVFGTPLAAIFLSIELLLFEFSPRSIIPVSIACITGAAGHYLLFHGGPFFEMIPVEIPSNTALAMYSVLGIVVGVLSVGVSKSVYLVEDLFEKSKIHYMWWPALGAIAAGVIGYFAPKTLGVGYTNITDLLMNSLPLNVIFGLCVLKFISWAVSLGSGTAGGTLAPLMIIGGASGSLIGMLFIYLFPSVDISISLAALLGMAAMFSGASRAVLTSIIFAVEATQEANALLPLLAACLAAYLVSFILMKNTIMTEKIARRGINVPDTYKSDFLVNIYVNSVIKTNSFVLSEKSTVGEAREWLLENDEYQSNYFIISSEDGNYVGILSSSSLYGSHIDEQSIIEDLVKRKNISISQNDNLRTAAKMMAVENIDVLPVTEFKEGKEQIIGVIGYRDIIQTYKDEMKYNIKENPNISLRRRSLKILLGGKKLLTKKKRS